MAERPDNPQNLDRYTDDDGLTWEYLAPPGTWALVAPDGPLTDVYPEEDLGS